jgi:lysyl-tRNA synthetase class 2
VTRLLTRQAVALLGRGFQMERLVCFNEKFSPDWRPRYLVYESRLGLPRAALRILQAEGYIPQRRRPRLRSGWHLPPRALPGPQRAKSAG